MSILEEDLRNIQAAPGLKWLDGRGMRLLLTGGTGFVGTWLLHSFARANRVLGLGAEAVVVVRNPDAAPLQDPAIKYVKGDVRNFTPPEGGFTHVIHAATPASAKLNEADPLEMIDIIVAGTRHVAGLAKQMGVKRFLFMSSGAVYGDLPQSVERVAEDYRGGPNPLELRSAYAEAKRVAELICVAAAKRDGFEAVIARGFAFVGPYLPLDIHFAVGNFIRDALKGGPIVVNGNGTPLRSYLYASDMAVWFWKLLFSGAAGAAYNVGSETAVSIADLAKLVGEIIPAKVSILGADKSTFLNRYLPSTEKARALGLRETISLREAIKRTAAWHAEPAPQPRRS